MFKFAKKSSLAIAMAILIVPVLSACGPNRTTDVTEQSYSIMFANNRTTLPSGKNTFVVHNTATDQQHEFVIFKTDLSWDQMPTNSDGSVIEDGQGVTHIDEIGGIDAGDTKQLTVDLQPGKYIAICNLTDPSSHFQAGMHYAFTVQ